MINKIEERSTQIQEILLGIPALSVNFIDFFELSNETKQRILSPANSRLKEYKISLEDVIETLDTYSKNLRAKNINSKSTEILEWLFEKQNDDGSWPLAYEHESGNIKNAWANAVCILSLLKFIHFNQLSNNKYNEKISKAVEWLLDPSIGIYISCQGWKQTKNDSGINIYDTSIALRAIFKYRSAYKAKKFTYKISDPEIVKVIENIINLAGEYPYWPDKFWHTQDKNLKDIGATSYALMTLVHFQNIFDEAEIAEIRESLNKKTVDTTQWLIDNYRDNLGWDRISGIPSMSLEISCYALQSLNKCMRFFLNRLRTDEKIEGLIERVVEIITSEVQRIGGLFTYKNNQWGWLEDNELKSERNISITNTALATSTLLKCSYMTDLKLDLSAILKSMNYLLNNFNKERITLENTYVLCTIMDYFFYRKDKKLIF